MNEKIHFCFFKSFREGLLTLTLSIGDSHWAKYLSDFFFLWYLPKMFSIGRPRLVLESVCLPLWIPPRSSFVLVKLNRYGVVFCTTRLCKHMFDEMCCLRIYLDALTCQVEQSENSQTLMLTYLTALLICKHNTYSCAVVGIKLCISMGLAWQQASHDQAALLKLRLLPLVLILMETLKQFKAFNLLLWLGYYKWSYFLLNTILINCSALINKSIIASFEV